MSSQNQPRQVNNLLHTLRGEQFRHFQNLRRSRTHLTSAFNRNVSTLTLPLGLTGPDYDPYPKSNLEKQGETPQSASSCPGPSAPKSWTLTAKQDVHDSAVWRMEALSLILSHLVGTETAHSRVPALSLLCLRSFISMCSVAEFKEDVVPFIPHHLRRKLIRYTAIHAPLPNSKLFPLYEPDGHADGELMIVGPATLRDDYFIKKSSRNDTHSTRKGLVESETSDWESDQPTPEILRTVVVMSTRLAMSTFLTLPPTVIHLALINIPSPVFLHRLPGLCPLIEVLDLSYNSWLSDSSNDLQVLDRLDWTRWSHLRVLGFRECYMPEGMLTKLNQGRWDDVKVVR